MHPALFWASVLTMFVSVVGLALAWVATGAYQRTRNKKLLFLPAAFALFFLKGISVAAAAYIDENEPHLENVLPWGILAMVLFDLLIIFLLVLPILLRKPHAVIAEPKE